MAVITYVPSFSFIEELNVSIEECSKSGVQMSLVFRQPMFRSGTYNMSCVQMPATGTL
jgi:hypothetical protein